MKNRFRIFTVIAICLFSINKADAIWIITPTGDKIEASKPQKMVVTLETNLMTKNNVQKIDATSASTDATSNSTNAVSNESLPMTSQNTDLAAQAVGHRNEMVSNTNRVIGSPEENPVKDFTIALTSDKKQLLLQWECEQADVQKFHIYRSSTPITNSAALPQTKTDIDKKIYYEDIPPVGVYYYAVTSEVDGVEIREVMTNRNTFAEPVRVEIVSITTQDSRVLEKKGTAFSKLQTAMGVRSYKECDVRFKKSLKSYYNNHKYRESIIDLGRIIKADECPADIINRAKLFLGKSYYYDKQYKMAFKCFFDLLKAFPAEADFWLKLTMGKMKDI